MLLADVSLSDALLVALEIFFLIVWIWILITILNDLFHDHTTGGWTKALWVLFLVVIPFLTALIYLIARGQGMRERAISRQAETKAHMDSYIRETASAGSPVDELAKLNAMKKKKEITDADYKKMKAKLLA